VTFRQRQKIIFSLLFIGISSCGIVLVGALLRSGFQYIGDGEIFVFRDNLLPFLGSLAACYLAGLAWCGFSIRLPLVDYVSRIIATNVAIYSLLGLTLTWLRIPLYSRSIILSEFFLSTLFILLFIFLRTRFFPPRIGVFSDPPKYIHGSARLVQWILLDPVRVDSLQLDAVATELDKTSTNKKQIELLAKLSQRGITVYDRRHIETLLTGRIKLDNLDLTEFDNFNPRSFYSPIKRLIDLLITLSLSPLLLLIGLIVSILIKLDSPGPVLFAQERTGYHNKNFILYKFRSMYTLPGGEATRFAEENDSRVTRAGRFLRRTRLDEIPQFWNVFKGDMSIIGPRPEQLEFAVRFTDVIPHYDFRHSIHPGITGWAQTMQGYAANEDQTREKLEYDFFYIKNLSLWFDLIIFFRTFRILFLGKGAR